MVKRMVNTMLICGVIAAFGSAAQASPAPEQDGLRGSGHEAGGRGRECTNASVQGSFGFSAEGTLLALPAPLAGPFAEIGRQTFDGRGNTEATGTLSANGNIFRVTVQGTYEVNPDCTASMTLNILPFGTTANFDFVIDDDGKELRAISSDPGAVEGRV